MTDEINSCDECGQNNPSQLVKFNRISYMGYF